jgi:hypothetical protein
MDTAITRLEWDIAYESLPESKKRLLLELATNLMPSEPPEPGDIEAHRKALDEYERGETVSLEEVMKKLNLKSEG